MLALFFEDLLQGLKVVEPLVKVLLGGWYLPWSRVMVPYHICIHILHRSGMGLSKKPRIAVDKFLGGFAAPSVMVPYHILPMVGFGVEKNLNQLWTNYVWCHKYH